MPINGKCPDSPHGKDAEGVGVCVERVGSEEASWGHPVLACMSMLVEHSMFAVSVHAILPAFLIPKHAKWFIQTLSPDQGSFICALLFDFHISICQLSKPTHFVHFYFAHRTFVECLYLITKTGDLRFGGPKTSFVAGLNDVSDRNFYKLVHREAKKV